MCKLNTNLVSSLSYSGRRPIHLTILANPGGECVYFWLNSEQVFEMTYVKLMFYWKALGSLHYLHQYMFCQS